MRIRCDWCDGIGEYHVVGGMDVFNYNPYEEWLQCQDCRGTGMINVTFRIWFLTKYYKLRWIIKGFFIRNYKRDDGISEEDLPF